MSERTCKKCGATKPATDFYPRQKIECKECTKKRVRENRAANIDYYREFDRQRANLPHRVEARKEYAKTERGKAALNRAKRVFISRNPEKQKAYMLTRYAIRCDKIINRPCESCGSPRAHAHHDDYSRPLDVRWLCPACHSAHHKAERQKQRSQETACSMRVT